MRLFNLRRRVGYAEVEEAHGQRLASAPEVDEVSDFDCEADQVDNQQDAAERRGPSLAVVVAGGGDGGTDDSRHDAHRDAHDEALDDYGHKTDPESPVAPRRRVADAGGGLLHGKTAAHGRGRRGVAAGWRGRRRVAPRWGRRRRQVAGRGGWVLHLSPAPQLVVTIVPAILSWIACFWGSHSCHSQPMAPMMQPVKPTSSTQMKPRRAALPMVGYCPVCMSRTLNPKGIMPIEAPRELHK